MRSSCRADDVVGGFNISDPIAHRFVEGVFEGLGSATDRMDFCTEELHSENVQLLPNDVFLAHVHLALQSKQGAGRSRCDAVLTRTGLGNDSLLAHSDGKQGLTDGVIDLVRAGVIKVFSLDRDMKASILAEVSCLSEGRRPSDVFGQEAGVLSSKRWVGPGDVELFFELLEGGH